jgi:diadenosine tetraphosphate (Ap4A) HIT family hydrolase
MDDCFLCAENAAAARGADEWAVARLSTGVVRLNRTQYYRGATFFAAHECVAELWHLAGTTRAAHLMEMAAVAESVATAFEAVKMNYEALGNTCRHLHWWITPRHADDPRPGAPIWENLDFLRAHGTEQAVPAPAERDELRRRLLDALPADLVIAALC